MRLSDLLNIDAGPELLRRDITGLTADSRAVKDGYLFAALSGTQVDGRRFIPSALEKGAQAILVEKGSAVDPSGAYIHAVDNPRKELAILSRRFFGEPPETIVGVTGTNGKTSVAHFVQAIWSEMGIKGASLGTLGIVTSEETQDLGYTTPEPVLMHEKLAALADAGVTHLAIEASSHGLDQFRLDALPMKAGAFTNLTHDHLDYHATEEEYLDAKLGLVKRVVSNNGTAVLNADAQHFYAFKQAATDRGLDILSYGRNGGDLKLLDVSSHGAGQQITVDIFGSRYSFDLRVAGEFQAMNILCALGLVVGAGGDHVAAITALPKIASVPGRMEHVARTAQGADVYVDYAHTPDALKTVLEALRPHTEGKIHVLVGCGGDRDRAKRPVMGKIAADLAEEVYVTDDNPRSEDPASIRKAVLEGCPNAREIGDREDAISAALQYASPTDVVLIAGKGHESGQTVGDQVIPFNDKDVAQKLVLAAGGTI